MKKTLLLIALLISVTLVSQTPDKKEIPADKIFLTLEDYLNVNPYPGYSIIDFSHTNNNYLKLRNSDGDVVKSKDLDLKSYYFTKTNTTIKSIDLWKYFDKDYYQVNYLGKLCYYTKYGSGGDEYYSETPEGEMKELSKKKFYELLEQYGLMKKYDADKTFNVEAKDGVVGAQYKKMWKKAKYFKLMSDQIK
jgi:hypothetical protein